MKREMLPVLVFLSAFALVTFSPACDRLPDPDLTKGSHGYRLWGGASIKSFAHEGFTCVPQGFEPLGHLMRGPHWAVYPDGYTGVLIRSASFSSLPIELEKSSYALTLRYPNETPPELLAEYERMTRNAFERAGNVFNDQEHARRPHTVFVTAGIPYLDIEDASIYPDPGLDVTYLILKPSQWRGEDLLIHAAMHLYNRHRPDLLSYQTTQQIPDSDFQELEASWAETAFNPSYEKRVWRLNYVYRVHQAVMTKNFSLITLPPFNDKAEFDVIIPRITPDHESFVETQYGHYILGPLVMIAIDGLLLERSTTTDVETLLTKLHAGEIENFFAEVARLLPEDAERIERWKNGTELIPYELLVSAARSY